MATISARIDTEFGEAFLWWDEQDPGNPGWVLRYHLERPDEGNEGTGRRNLDEILSCDDPDDVDAARTEAEAILRREGVRMP